MQVSNAEWQVMKVIWTKSPMTSQEIFQALETKCEWSLSTVKTLLGRLVMKKGLTAELIGNKNLLEEFSMKTSNYSVKDMTCGGCLNKIERTLASVTGVERVQGNLSEKTVAVTFDGTQVSNDAIIEKIKETGYTAVNQ